MGKCIAYREAVEEAETHGEVGCPVCGREVDDHDPMPLFESQGVEAGGFTDELSERSENQHSGDAR